MTYNAAGVEALVAIADHGTFEAAARALHVSPSAVSQRIRALEREVGHVVVRRGTPCQPTEAGAALVRLGRQSRLLDDEARAALQAETGRVEVTAAVNADSLATWFRDVLAEVGGRDDLTLRLVVEDQAYSAALLRSGEALAAVTSDPQVVQGCRSEHLGFLRYRPAATPELAERWRKGNGPRLAAAAGGRLQRQGRRSSTTSSATGACPTPTSSTSSPPAPTSTKRSGSAWAGGCFPSPSCSPTSTPAGWSRSAAAPATTSTCTGSAGGSTRRRWTTLTDAVRRAAAQHLRR